MEENKKNIMQQQYIKVTAEHTEALNRATAEMAASREINERLITSLKLQCDLLHSNTAALKEHTRALYRQ